MKIKSLIICVLTIAIAKCDAQSNFVWKEGKSGGYDYRYVTNDPTKTRFYTLKNGLTVILSQNNQSPEITFKMAVRTGSNSDPKNNTGLAHYLEHLLFKGTDKYGSLDYAKELPLLNKIEALYENYNHTNDAVKRKEIYKEIDKVSGEASKYSVANEYDKMMKAIGSRGTNAHTSVEETVYEETLPSNSIDKFLAIQAERFRAPVFRLFHTELEAVYEEKNRGLDNDDLKSYEAMLKALFPTHNYGQQTTLGTIEHLKNPSLIEIRKYYNKYYVPNNMALIMSGDINFDQLIAKIDKNFSYMKSQQLNDYAPAPESPQQKVINVQVSGPSPESLTIGYRGFPSNSKKSLMLDLIANILSNRKAGLIDVNIMHKQSLLDAGAEYQQMKDYGVFMLFGYPKEGQKLSLVQHKLLEQISLLKQGKFDESLIPATVANMKFQELRAYDNNSARAYAAMTSFIQDRGKQWDKVLSSTNEMAKISKKELTDFAKTFFGNNYVIVNKLQGEDKNKVKVEKPIITAIQTNTNETSAYSKKILSERDTPIAPKFLDYKKDLSFGKSKIADVIHVQNKENQIYKLSFRFDKGSLNYKLLPYAIDYLNYLSTDKYTSEQINKSLYDIASSYDVSVGSEVTTVSLTGLQENFERALSLVEDVLKNCKPNENALSELKRNILKSRENAKLDKKYIMSGLSNYALYGEDNPFNYDASNEEIKQMNSSNLISLIHNLTNYNHTILYYGPEPLEKLSNTLERLHNLPKNFTPEAPMKKFVYQNTDSNKVFFADYDMVQAEIQWVRNGGLFNPKISAVSSLFNNYFGKGMGSLVAQTLRESRALAYTAYASYVTPDSREKQTSVVAYIGTQADKMNDAIIGMNELLGNLPESEEAFNLSKINTINQLETERITKYWIINTYLNDKKLGFNYDSRIDVYAKLKGLTLKDIKTFHDENLRGKAFNYCVVSSAKNIDIEKLKMLGTVIKVDLRTLFGY